MKNNLRFVVCILFLLAITVISPAYASEDITWTNLGSETYGNMYYLNNQYIITAISGTIGQEDFQSIIKVSSDYENWTTYELGNTVNINDLVYENQAYWLLDTTGSVYRSSDLLNWEKTNTTPVNARHLFFKENKFYAVGGSIYISVDGYTWEEHPIPADTLLGVLSFGIEGVVCNENGITFIGRDSRKRMVFSMTSADGISWKAQENTIQLPRTLLWDGIKYITFDGNNRSTMYTSTDGLNWVIDREFDERIYYADYINGTIIAIDSEHKLNLSNNSKTWQSIQLSEDQTLRNIIFDGTSYYCHDNYDGLYKSSDGLNWTVEQVSTFTRVNEVVWDGKVFVAALDNGYIATSKDAINWAYQALEIAVPSEDGTFNIEGISCYGDTTMIAISYTDGFNVTKVFISTDRNTWKELTYKKFGYADINDVLYDGSMYFAIGGNLFYSKNGKQWSDIDESFKGSKNTITTGKGMYVVGGTKTEVGLSTNGKLFTAHKLSDGHPYSLFNMSFDGSQFIASDLDDIYTSTDGKTWARNSKFDPDINFKYLNVRGITATGTTYLALTDYRRPGYYMGTKDGSTVITLYDGYTKTSFIEGFNVIDVHPIVTTEAQPEM